MTQPEQLPANDAQLPQCTRYEVIENALRTKQAGSRIALALGHNADDMAGKTETFKYISSVLMEIKKTECPPKETDNKKLNKDLTFCTPDSIVQAIIDAASFRLPIDGRGLAHLVKYGAKASFMPGYRGYLYKIAENYRDVDFTAEPVFEGDELELFDESGYQTYKHRRTNPFQTAQNKMTGIIACLSYTDNAGRHSKISTLAKSEIDQIRGAAKQDFIWEAWFFEKAKVAALKRLCKVHFATIMGVQELTKFDNEEHFAIENLSTRTDHIVPPDPAKKISGALHLNMLQQGATGNELEAGKKDEAYAETETAK
jgi:recombinational DNA repair protein RecT